MQNTLGNILDLFIAKCMIEKKIIFSQTTELLLDNNTT